MTSRQRKESQETWIWATKPSKRKVYCICCGGRSYSLHAMETLEKRSLHRWTGAYLWILLLKQVCEHCNNGVILILRRSECKWKHRQHLSAPQPVAQPSCDSCTWVEPGLRQVWGNPFGLHGNVPVQDVNLRGLLLRVVDAETERKQRRTAKDQPRMTSIEWICASATLQRHGGLPYWRWWISKHKQLA